MYDRRFKQLPFCQQRFVPLLLLLAAALLSGIRPAPENLPTLHAFLIIDEEDQQIGSARDGENILRWLWESSRIAGLDLQVQEIQQSSFLGPRLQQELERLCPGPEDVVFVYFSGHGSEACQRYPSPVFRMPGGICFSQPRLHDRLWQARPRLLITMFDCCLRSGQVAAMNSRSSTMLDREAQANVRRLWRASRGHLQLRANTPQHGHASYGNPYDGGLFTNRFLHSYYLAIEAEEDQCHWPHIALRTRQEVQHWAERMNQVQVPEVVDLAIAGN